MAARDHRAWRARTERIEGDNASLARGNSELENRVSVLERENGGLKGRVTDLERENGELKRENRDLNEKVGLLEKKVEELENKIEAMMAEFAKAIAGRDEMNKKLHRKIKTLEAKAAVQAATVAAQAKEIETLKQKMV